MSGLAFKNKSTFSSTALRYRNPTICDHLASQYVAGVLTPRVRARLERLLPGTPELNRAVAFWSDKMADVQLQLPEQSPSQDIWNKIDKLTPLEEKPSDRHSTVNKSWWANLLLWQTAGVAGMATSFALALFLFFAPVNQTGTGFSTPNYMAAMSAHNGGSDEIHFVINAYQKSADNPSRLFIQWSKGQARQHKAPLFLWAKDKDTGKLTYIGNEPAKGEPWHLIKPTWQAIANSSHLFITLDQQQPNEANTLFSGPCIQLSEWNKKTT